MRLSPARVAFFVTFGVLLPAAACGTGALDVGFCNQVEDARCVRAAQLSNMGPPCIGPNLDGGDSSVVIDLLAPWGDASAGTDANIAACVDFYNTACLHGLQTTDQSITAGQVSECVAAISGGNCQVVANPTTASQCSWLIPIAEAGPDAEASVVIPVETGVVFDTGVPVDAGEDVVRDGQPDCPLP
jgi:hypothetical protein